MFNINHYDKQKFNDDKKIDSKIKALFLLFDKQIDDLNLSYHQKQELINVWISKLILHEEYEIAEAFKKRKMRMWKKWRTLHRYMSFNLFYRVWRMRFHKLKIKFFLG